MSPHETAAAAGTGIVPTPGGGPGDGGEALGLVDRPVADHIRYFPDVVQGSDAWLECRRGKLTASEMHLIVTAKTSKPSSNQKERAHLYELLAQRITGHVEPQYVSDAMLRGHVDEIEARILYAATYAPVEEVGFVTNDRWGFTLGCSPDGLVGDDGMIECKSRGQKFQVETIIKHAMPDDYQMQVQTALLVTERKWCDFVSYCGGMPMVTIRVFPDPVVQDAIVAAADAFEDRIARALADYEDMMASDARLIPTERRIEQEMF